MRLKTVHVIMSSGFFLGGAIVVGIAIKTSWVPATLTIFGICFMVSAWQRVQEILGDV